MFSGLLFLETFFSSFFQRRWPRVTILGPLRDLVRPKMASIKTQAAPKSSNLHLYGGASLRSWTWPSTRIHSDWLLMDVGKLFMDLGPIMIDAKSIFCNFDRIVDGFVDVLGHPFWTDVCECLFFTLQITKQGSHKICQDLPRSVRIKQDQPKDR